MRRLPRRIALAALAVVGAVVALPVVVFALYSVSFLDLPTGTEGLGRAGRRGARGRGGPADRAGGRPPGDGVRRPGAAVPHEGWAEDVEALHAGHDVDDLAAAVYDNPDGDELSVVFGLIGDSGG